MIIHVSFEGQTALPFTYNICCVVKTICFMGTVCASSISVRGHSHYPFSCRTQAGNHKPPLVMSRLAARYQGRFITCLCASPLGDCIPDFLCSFGVTNGVCATLTQAHSLGAHEIIIGCKPDVPVLCSDKVPVSPCQTQCLWARTQSISAAIEIPSPLSLAVGANVANNLVTKIFFAGNTFGLCTTA